MEAEARAREALEKAAAAEAEAQAKEEAEKAEAEERAKAATEQAEAEARAKEDAAKDEAAAGVEAAAEAEAAAKAKAAEDTAAAAAPAPEAAAADAVTAQQAWLAREIGAEGTSHKRSAPSAPSVEPISPISPRSPSSTITGSSFRPLVLHANQSPRAPKASTTPFSTSAGPAVEVPPVFLHPNQAPTSKKPAKLLTSLHDASSGVVLGVQYLGVLDAPPVALRPNQAPVKASRPPPAVAPQPTAPEAATSAAPKAGSAVSADIFDKPFAEPVGGGVHSYGALTTPVNELPAGVDPRRREQYLSDADFERVLGTSRQAFGSLKTWRQNELKRKARLF